MERNKEIVKLVIQAFVDADVATALTYMTDDIQMSWPGFFDLNPGKITVKEFFATVPEIVESEMDDLIAEGNKVVGTGSVTSKHKDGSIKKSFFSDVYELENEKIKSIRSYMVFEQSDPR